MKHPIRLLFHIFTLAVFALTLCTSATSCAGVFTQDDAKDIGSFLAKESLALASAKLAGENVDLESSAHALGIRAANMAAQRIAGNLQQGQPTDMLNAALVAATHQMQQSKPDEQVSDLASQIAADAVEQAKGEALELPAGTSAKTAILVTPS